MTDILWRAQGADMEKRLDIVKRLRGLKSYAVEEMQTAPPGMCGVSADVLFDMIAEIEQLSIDLNEALLDVERLRAALEPFAKAGTMTFRGDGLVEAMLFCQDIEIARKALKGET